ncbi:methyltransferase [Novipirellula artificiosorum]|uniref:N5-glutamine S-adenosyl-L-methionine-dependent methyltransferase n=1 Tax=Novipirellula artificiosorum TaxID=2528016 RepID=A0A5C6DAS9_9BACT|nr:methyltransferase [Novipirellula artificiosorum]TWU32871.1 N5-glutamine S-adenosyl-L-methionine-dependent methyltransferase [Novipirellula artificiosorum]
MRIFQRLLAFVFVCPLGCSPNYRDDLDYSYEVVQTWPNEDIHFGEIVQFAGVPFEPDDTAKLRKMIVDDAIVSNRDVLQIGIETGLLAVLCLQNDAGQVVAIDANPAAVENTRYNAATLSSEDKLDVRQIPADAVSPFSVIKPGEKFDLILCNLPWIPSEEGKRSSEAVQDAILDELPNHLSAGGKCLFVYGNQTAIERLQGESEQRNLACKQLDDRTLDSLDQEFRPGMLLELRLALPTPKVSDADTIESSSE